MKKILFIYIILLSSCELIEIGTKKTSTYEIDQDTPLGIVYLFKAGLDSNNIHYSSQLLANDNGNYMLAFDRYELYDEISRIRRLIGNREITYITSDTIGKNTYNIQLEFDYIKTISFRTEKTNRGWYITNYSEQ